MLKRENLKEYKVRIVKDVTELINDKQEVIASLPCLYVGKRGTYTKNIKSAFLWVDQNKAVYNKLLKAYQNEPVSIIASLEAEAMKLAEKGKFEWLQAFRADTYIFKYSICLLFGIPQGKIDNVKLANGTSATRLKDVVTDEQITTPELATVNA